MASSTEHPVSMGMRKIVLLNAVKYRTWCRSSKNSLPFQVVNHVCCFLTVNAPVFENMEQCLSVWDAAFYDPQIPEAYVAFEEIKRYKIESEEHACKVENQNSMNKFSLLESFGSEITDGLELTPKI